MDTVTEADMAQTIALLGGYGVFTGLATTRDFESADPSTPVGQVMKPRNEVRTVLEGTTLEEAVDVMKKYRVEKVPIVDADGKLKGMYTLKDNEYYQDNQTHRSIKWVG